MWVKVYLIRLESKNNTLYIDSGERRIVVDIIINLASESMTIMEMSI